VDFVFETEFDPHTPTRIRCEQAPKVLDWQFLIVDLDHGLPMLVIADGATQHIPARSPLIAPGVRLDPARTSCFASS